jgi:hypothetical protein
MRKKIKYWIEFWRTGSFVGESWNVYVTEKPNKKKIKFPDSAYSCRFFQRTDVIVDGKTYEGKAEQIGKWYYHPDSKVMTLEEIKALNNPNDRILISNMECNGWISVIYTRWGNWPQPFAPINMEILKG